jgi:hypothetical protein
MATNHNDLFPHTEEVWQPRTSRRLTDEDLREIAENTAGFFRVLMEWEQRQDQENRLNDLNSSDPAISA